MDNRRIFKKSDEVVTREIEGELILLPLYKSSKEMNYIYTFNETAAALWGLIDGKMTLGEIKEDLKEKFAVEDEKLERQINEFINDIKTIKAIKAYRG